MFLGRQKVYIENGCIHRLIIGGWVDRQTERQKYRLIIRKYIERSLPRKTFRP